MILNISLQSPKLNASYLSLPQIRKVKSTYLLLLLTIQNYFHSLKKSSKISFLASKPTAINTGFPVAKPIVEEVAQTAHSAEYFTYLPPHISNNMPAVQVVALIGFENLVTFFAGLTYLSPGPITVIKSLYSQLFLRSVLLGQMTLQPSF